MCFFELLPGQIGNRCRVFAFHCRAHHIHQDVPAATECVRSLLISPEIPRLLDHLITACHASIAPQTATDKTRAHRLLPATNHSIEPGTSTSATPQRTAEAWQRDVKQRRMPANPAVAPAPCDAQVNTSQ